MGLRKLTLDLGEEKRSERVDLSLLTVVSGLVEQDLDLGRDGRKEIHPCVLHDIGPFGPLP